MTSRLSSISRESSSLCKVSAEEDGFDGRLVAQDLQDADIISRVIRLTALDVPFEYLFAPSRC